MTFPRSIFAIPCLPAHAGQAGNLRLARYFDFFAVRPHSV
jgi:hypothetical protein